MTSGWHSGTSGWAGVSLRVWAGTTATMAFVLAINVSSVLIDAERLGHRLPAWKVITWEATSILVILALLPAVAWGERRLRPERAGLVRTLAGHAGMLAAFSVVHVAGMVALRAAAYATAGQTYDFGPVGTAFFYEVRKDALTYGVLVAVLVLDRRLRRPASESTAASAPAERRIEVRSGERRLWLTPAEIAWAEAAGNYVELCTGTVTYLVRDTLAALERRLEPDGFVRVHRSRLVNAARVRSIETNPSGDFTVTLDSGAAVGGSRRYREQLVAAAPKRAPPS